MSFDLHFYSKSENPVSKSSIEDYLQQLPNIIPMEDGQWVYQNDETGVHCRFEYFEMEEHEEHQE